MSGYGRLLRRIERHNRHAIESQWSADECLAWAEEFHARHRRWPARRWRVAVGSLSSRLLSHSAAHRCWERYGGALVEVIPTRTEAFARAAVLRRSDAGGFPSET